ncbi:hypothetical protein LP414_26090 [Polaromonas sp. P1(28)-13]|nr:hypothetical protein LP414_26090 [Polaromonas sp. P1(28)-13]
MTVEMDDTDKLKILFGDAQKMGIKFESPDVNRGDYRFEPTSNTSVRYGLGAIKGTGQQAIAAIVAARNDGGPFTSLYDFCVRVDRSRLNKRTVEALIKGGAFDNLHLNRAELLASVDRAFEFSAATEANANQGGLFDMSDSHAASTQEPDLVEAVPFGVKARLVLEKTAIGFYLSGHLFDEVEAEVRQFAKRKIEDLIDSREPQLLAAIVSDLRVINGNRGKLIIFKLDDKTDVLEASVDETVFNAHRNLLKDDELVIVQGTLQGRVRALWPSFQGHAGVGSGDGALQVRQVFARGRQRHGAGHFAHGERLSATFRNDGAGGAEAWFTGAPEPAA